MTTYHPDTAHTSQSESQSRGNGADLQGLIDSTRDQLEKTQVQARDAAHEARQQVSASAQSASYAGAQFVRDNPALSLVGAAGLGVVLGMVLRKR